MMGWWWMVGMAWASDPASGEVAPAPVEAGAPEHDVPLAVPVGREPPPRAEPSRSERPLAVPGRRPLNAQDIDAIRTYRREHLSVRGFHEVWVGSTTTTTGYYGGRWGWWGGWGWSTPYVVEVDRWAVLQGTHHLTVPEALDALGDPGGRVQLERTIRRKKTAGTVWYALGGASIATSIVALVGLDQARSYDEAYRWRTVSTIGMLGGATAFVAGSFPLGRARSLAVDPSLTLDRADAERRAEDANARLAAELGLSPEQALRLEGEGRSRD